jgi:Ca2+-binding RTX toxin-like protein
MVKPTVEQTLDLILVGTTFTGGRMTILHGDGLGGFVKDQTINIANSIHNVAVADFDKDGDLDIADTNESPTHHQFLSIGENSGHGTYTFSDTEITASPASIGLFALDVDGDDDTDLLSAEGELGRIAVFKNDGTGTFSSPTYSAVSDQHNIFYNAFVADADGDNDPDLYTVVNHDFGLMINDGSGSYSLFGSTSRPNAQIFGVKLMDLEGDGDLELVANGGSTIYFATPPTAGAATTTWYGFNEPMPAGDVATAFDVGDLNNDGLTDIVTANAATDSYTIMMNTAGDFNVASHALAEGAAPTDIRIADVDDDGDLDILLSLSGTGNAAILLNNLDGSYTEIDTPKDSGLNLTGFYLGKVNGSIDGTNKDDSLKGTAAADLIRGFDGNDKIQGGKGIDEMSGGKGNDRFVFTSLKDSSTGVHNDVITDFRHDQDRLDLSKLHPDTPDDKFDFIGEHKFHKNAGEVRVVYDAPAGMADHTYVQVDFDGNGKADMTIDLHGIVKLDTGDFVL